MNDDFLSRGLAALAEEMPAPDVGDIVGIARERNRRRRAVGATVLGTLAAVGVLTGTVLATRGHPIDSPADRQHPTPTVDARVQSLDQQWAQSEHQLLPGANARVDLPGFGVYDTDYAPGTLADDRTGTPIPFTRSPFAGRSYRLTATVNAGGGWSRLTIIVLHSTYAAPDAIPVAGVADAVPSQLKDGTKAVVYSFGSGAGVEMEALRTDGTFIDVSYAGLPTSGGATGGGLPPGMTSAADMTKFALAFTY